jgi:hypothetical protein
MQEYLTVIAISLARHTRIDPNTTQHNTSPALDLTGEGRKDSVVRPSLLPPNSSLGATAVPSTVSTAADADTEDDSGGMTCSHWTTLSTWQWGDRGKQVVLASALATCPRCMQI